MQPPVIKEKPRTLYQVIIDDILVTIERGAFSYDHPICTESKLMEQYSVSRITARRAMTELENLGILYRKRGVGSFVSRDIYQKKQTTQEASNLFAFIFPFDLSRSGLSTMFQAANQLLIQSGYAASIYITEDDARMRGRAFLNQLIHSNIAGVAYYPKTSDVHLSLLNHLVFQKKPVVLIDIPSQNRYISSVSSDNFGGSTLLTEHMMSLGHRHIAYVSGLEPDARKTLSDRLDGYVMAMSRAGIALDSSLIVTTLTEYYRRMPGESGVRTKLHDTIEALLTRGVTAVLCEHDQLAFEIAMACREMGIKVPERLSICGFDNSEWARMLPEGLTTVQQDMEAVGRRTAELLLEGLGRPIERAQQVVVPTKLIVGNTTGRANA